MDQPGDGKGGSFAQAAEIADRRRQAAGPQDRSVQWVDDARFAGEPVAVALDRDADDEIADVAGRLSIEETNRPTPPLRKASEVAGQRKIGRSSCRARACQYV